MYKSTFVSNKMIHKCSYKYTEKDGVTSSLKSRSLFKSSLVVANELEIRWCKKTLREVCPNESFTVRNRIRVFVSECSSSLKY